MTRAAALGVSLAVVAGCATGRAAVAFDLVARREAARGAQLRVDDGGRPYLIVRDAIVPLAKLPSGADASPFRVAGADPIGDLAWTAEGVPLLVVGAQLGTLSEHGFAAFLALPEPGMRAVPATADRLWLFAPRAADGGRLYLYTRGGGLALVVRAAEAPRGVRFLTRSRVFSDNKCRALDAAGPPHRGPWPDADPAG